MSFESVENTTEDVSFAKDESHQHSSYTHYGSDLSDQDFFDTLPTQILTNHDFDDKAKLKETPWISEGDAVSYHESMLSRLELTFRK